jgi:undecaprenyl-diphosphatase
MSLLVIALLAVVQGMAELLPVSSSAHVIVAEKLLGLDPTAPEMTFLLVMLHTGTMVAVILHFRRRWWKRLTGPDRNDFVVSVIVATLVTGALGLVLKHAIELVLVRGGSKGEIEELFGNVSLIALALAAAGALILFSGRFDRPGGESRVGTRRSLAIGAVQACCLPFRGFSRSGATISAGMAGGLSRELSEELSFALGVAITPAVIGREAMRLFAASEAPAGSLLVPGLAGAAVSFAAGLAALWWLEKWLQSSRWKFFGYYCLAAAALLWTLHRCGVL